MSGAGALVRVRRLPPATALWFVPVAALFLHTWAHLEVAVLAWGGVGAALAVSERIAPAPLPAYAP